MLHIRIVHNFSLRSGIISNEIARISYHWKVWSLTCLLHPWCVDKYLLWVFYHWRENVHKRQWTPKSSARALGSGQQNQFPTQHVCYMGCEGFEVTEGLRVVCYCINRQYILGDSWHIKNIRDLYFTIWRKIHRPQVSFDF